MNQMISLEDRAEHYERIERIAKVGSWRWESATKTLWWSPGMHEIFGTDPDSFDDHRQTLFDMAIEEDRHILEAAAERCAKTGIPEHLSYRIRRPNGEIRQVWACCETTYEADGEPIARGYVFDVSDRVEADTHVRDEQRMHEAQRLESLGVLAGGIAHDFNNILTGVLGRLGIALELAGEGSPVGQLIHDAQLAAERAAALARNLLTYAGKRAPTRGAFRLDPAIEQLHGLLRTAVDHRHRFVMELGAGEACVFLGRNELSQVVLNLVTNASEAMRERAGVVTLRTGTQELSEAELAARQLGGHARAGNFAWLEVEDQGPGMSPEIVAHLFEPFYSTKSQGRGLGMSVLRRILHEAGGVALVDTREGSGTRIRLSFPVSELAPDEVRPAATSSDAAFLGGAVLVIDDEDLVLDSTREMLELLGFEVHAFGDPIDALEHHARAKQDFVLAIVDLTMPRLGGVEVLRELKRRDPRLPVVLMTGYLEDEIPSNDDEPRHDVLLIKPFSVREFRAQLLALLGKR